MIAALPVTVDGRVHRVDGRDVAAALGVAGNSDAGDPAWRERAARYVELHPRPRGRGGTTGIAAAQRLALLRRLAAGPATTEELLAALRTTGWVGASDLANRLRELRAADSRAGSDAGLALTADGDRVALAEPFPALSPADRQALAFAKAMVGRVSGPIAARALAALDGLLPDLPAAAGARTSARYRATASTLAAFDSALVDRRPIRVRYFSRNTGRESSYELVPIEYATLGATVKALCVPVDAQGQRAGTDRQFALDRVIGVTDLTDWAPPARDALRLRRSRMTLEVADSLYQVMRERDLFGIGSSEAVEIDHDVWRVSGTFPDALAWDAMEQLCAWAGSAQVHEPLWLVNAVSRRLRAGLRVMETAGPFELVKPEVGRVFPSHGEALNADGREEPTEGGLARPIRPGR